MPTSAEKLAARRDALGLPATYDVQGTAVPVTGDLCTWIEQVALHAAVPWTVTPVASGPIRGRDQLELRIGPPNHASVRVYFDGRGRWTDTPGAGGHHLTSGYWDNSRKAGELARATEFYGNVGRQEWYEYALTLPAPPAWAVQRQHQARIAAMEEDNRQRATRLDAIRRKAYAEAVRLLKQRHEEEFADLLEQQSVIAALEMDAPRLAFA